MNEQQRRFIQLNNTLARKGFQLDRSETRKIRFTGFLHAAGRPVGIGITFADLEFTTLPEVKLLTPQQEAPNVVAHLSATGVLCFARNEDLVLDRYDVGGTALACLQLAQRGLERVLTHKTLQAEIAQEFPQHWGGLNIYYDLGKMRRSAMLYGIPRGSNSVGVLSDDPKVLQRLVVDVAERLKIVRSAHASVVFRTDKELTFLRDEQAPKTWTGFTDWLKRYSSDWPKLAHDALLKGFPESLPSLFVVGPNGCVGARVSLPTNLALAGKTPSWLRGMLAIKGATIPISRLSGDQIGSDFMITRNLQDGSSLAGRRIALVGCGTIGGYLAKLLVQSGAGFDDGTLSLFDNQTFQPGNVGRHFLGMNSIGLDKVDAVKTELNRQYPEANIQGKNANAIQYLDRLTDFDLLIDATGEEAVSIAINDFCINAGAKGKAPTQLYVRLFGNGASAQAILVDRADFACFKCLKPELDRDGRFNPLKPGVEPIPRTAACGETQYIPYGAAAPVIAAGLALRLALDWVEGDPSPRLRTINISKNLCKEVADKNPARSDRCPACKPNI